MKTSGTEDGWRGGEESEEYIGSHDKIELGDWGDFRVSVVINVEIRPELDYC